VIADTTFFIDLLIGRDDAKQFAADHYLTTTTITQFEIYQGLQDDERERVETCSMNYSSSHSPAKPLE
jgi:predicted nucleic acid-binding protein